MSRSGKKNFHFGYVHRFTRTKLFYVTSKPYASQNTDVAAVNGLVLSGASFRPFLEDKMTINADVVSFGLLQTYFPPVALDPRYQQAGQTDSDYHEDMTISADVVSFELLQTYFPPVVLDPRYQQASQTDSDYHEDMTIGADVTSFELVQTYFPPLIVDPSYQQASQPNTDHHEDMTIQADITSFALVQTA